VIYVRFDLCHDKAVVRGVGVVIMDRVVEKGSIFSEHCVYIEDKNQCTTSQ